MMPKLKLCLPLAVTIMAFTRGKAQQKMAISTITLSNNANIELLDKAISIKRAVIDKSYTKTFPLLICRTDKIGRAHV